MIHEGSKPRKDTHFQSAAARSAREARRGTKSKYCTNPTIPDSHCHQGAGRIFGQLSSVARGSAARLDFKSSILSYAGHPTNPPPGWSDWCGMPSPLSAELGSPTFRFPQTTRLRCSGSHRSLFREVHRITKDVQRVLEARKPVGVIF